MDFKTFIAEFQEVDAPMGDFANDVVRDANFPVTQEYDVIKQYIARQAHTHSNEELLHLFQVAWDFYSEIR